MMVFAFHAIAVEAGWNFIFYPPDAKRAGRWVGGKKKTHTHVHTQRHTRAQNPGETIGFLWRLLWSRRGNSGSNSIKVPLICRGGGGNRLQDWKGWGVGLWVKWEGWCLRQPWRAGPPYPVGFLLQGFTICGPRPPTH